MEVPNNLTKVQLTPRATDYSQWYLDVAKQGDLFEYSPVPGCITFLPKAVSLWEKMKQEADARLKRLGVQNLYLPMLIPMSFFEREKDHVAGFAPELAVVTHAGGAELTEKLAIRPTSETLFCDFFKNKLQSYRELPLLYNQWVNVMRWEKRTRPFLRTAEFYWQEGHTLHETKGEADVFARSIMNNVYIDIFRNYLAIDGIAGIKSESEKFAGAERTYTFEPMMSNGWAIQIATSHVLGSGFMEQFDVSFLGRDGVQHAPSYTSWGFSTRSIGGIISSHSDDRGLVIPPRMSEYSAVILPIYKKDNIDTVNAYARRIAALLSWVSDSVPVQGESFRAFRWTSHNVLVDFRDVRLGEKITDFELSGYPVRIECWERDIAEQSCMVTSRITGQKTPVRLTDLSVYVAQLLEEGQKILFDASSRRLHENVIACASAEDIGRAVESGKFAIYAWDQNPDFEKEMKEKYKATTRCIPFRGQFTDDLLTISDPAKVPVIFARNF